MGRVGFGAAVGRCWAQQHPLHGLGAQGGRRGGWHSHGSAWELLSLGLMGGFSVPSPSAGCCWSPQQRFALRGY